MDSLTQIVLGAACGEVALGKKIGNKAMLFGAIGGTIPDLDVILGKLLFGNEIDALAFHRGIMHSVVFAVLGAFVIGMLTFRAYNRKERIGTTTQKDWIWLFFLSIFTHPILDSFTPYGTQLFLPFNDYRVAFNTISVVDPLYTLPFLICLLVAMFYKRQRKGRLWWTQAGIYLSTGYLVLTLVNKNYIDSIFQKSFDKEEVSYKRFTAQPTLLNNLLWYGIAETDSSYVVGFYSLLDTKKEVDTLLRLPKTRAIVDLDSPEIQTLRWFSNDYYAIHAKPSKDTLTYTDLRYPLLNPEDPNSSIFQFKLFKTDGRWDIESDYKDPSQLDGKKFVQRIFGK